MMEFTGERYVPLLRGQIYYEHLHRYAIALRFCAGKRVLDIASGEGYGSALLARTAADVIGVDVDQRSVEHSRRTYYAANLRFMRGSVHEIPLADGSVDVVASFETIEHVSEHERMLDELQRVLTPGGVLVISSPNKLVYSDVPGFSNPFHLKELYFAELRDLLVRRFRHVAFYGQRLTASSVVHPLAGGVSEAPSWYSGSVEGIETGLPTLRDPMYFVAICSDATLTIDASSSYLDPGDDLLSDIWGELNSLRSRSELATSQSVQVALTESVEFPELAADPQHALPADAPVLDKAFDEAPADFAGRLAAAEEECARLCANLAARDLAHARLEGEALVAAEIRSKLEAEVVLAREEAQHWATRARDEAQADVERFREGLESEIARLQGTLEAERTSLERRLAGEVKRVAALKLSLASLNLGLEREHDRVVALAAEVYEERARSACLMQQLADVRRVRSELAAAKGQHSLHEDQIAALRRELNRAEADNQTLLLHIADLREALESARRDSIALREVLSSRSWKVTAPLRRAFGTMRRDSVSSRTLNSGDDP